MHSRSRYLIAATVVAALATLSGTARANPKDIPAGATLDFNFNVIGYPADRSYDGNCGNGHRFLVNRDAKSARILIQNSTDDWLVVDCNATADHQAVIATFEVATVDIY